MQKANQGGMPGLQQLHAILQVWGLVVAGGENYFQQFYRLGGHVGKDFIHIVFACQSGPIYMYHYTNSTNHFFTLPYYTKLMMTFFF